MYRSMMQDEICSGYEHNKGAVIAERFTQLNSTVTPAVLVKNQRLFAWGKDALEAVHNAVFCKKFL